MVNDIGRAFFHAPAKRRVYVQLPGEDRQDGERQMCGRLNFSMHGTTDVAQNEFDAYSQHLVEVCSKQGRASPCTLHQQEEAVRIHVHGGDYVSTGRLEQIQRLREQPEKISQVKTQILGPKEDQLKQVKTRNRIIAWDDQRGLGYEADPRSIEITSQQLALKDAKALSTPGTKEEGRFASGQEMQMDREQPTKYRARVARCNSMSLDWPDVPPSAKALTRNMSNPKR